MARLAGISGREAAKKFQRIGYSVVRQRGSHLRLRHSDGKNHLPLTIPMHREVKFGLLKQLIKDAGLSVDEFLEL